MKTLFLLLLAVPAFAVDTIDHLDVERYMGTWHEIAAIPQSFQKDCYRNTTAEYQLMDDGKIQVINSCEKEDGEMKSAEGRARQKKNQDKASKLQVTFVKFFNSWVWALSGNYWILDLEENYQWSVVGDPSLKYLWILSRTPKLNKKTLLSIRRFIEDAGYDSCDVLVSRQDKDNSKERQALCDL